MFYYTGFKSYFPPSYKISDLNLSICFYIIYTDKPQYVLCFPYLKEEQCFHLSNTLCWILNY